MAANRQQTMGQALRTVWSRGGVSGFYQGLIPWAWIEASTKGAVLLFTAAEVEKVAVSSGIDQASAGLLGGISGGVAQAYATMGEFLSDHAFRYSSDLALQQGFTTCMKTVEITREAVTVGTSPPATTSATHTATDTLGPDINSEPPSDIPVKPKRIRTDQRAEVR